MTRYSQKFQATKCSNNLKLYTLKALLNKNRFCFFFPVFFIQKFHHLSGNIIAPSISINSSLIILFKFFAFFRFNMSSQKSDKNNGIKVCFIKKGSSERTLLHIRCVLHWSGTESNKKKSICCFITHFMSHKVFRNKFHCRRISNDSFTKHVLSLIAFRNNL